jgi:hypothetical protein
LVARDYQSDQNHLLNLWLVSRILVTSSLTYHTASSLFLSIQLHTFYKVILGGLLKITGNTSWKGGKAVQER